jgi:predicted nucleotidyltransferase
MSQTYEFPAVTDELLREVVDRIRKAGEPIKIILFGSHAGANPRADSDLDILIIEESQEPRFRRAVPYYRALNGLFPAKDIIVYTPGEVRDWADVPNAFITTAIRTGKVLYEQST